MLSKYFQYVSIFLNFNSDTPRNTVKILLLLIQDLLRVMKAALNQNTVHFFIYICYVERSSVIFAVNCFLSHEAGSLAVDQTRVTNYTTRV